MDIPDDGIDQNCIGGDVSERREAPEPVAPVPAALPRDFNVLLVTIDTLRSDRVGAFGGPANLTPTLDRLAAEGLRLTRTYSSAPLTLPMPMLFTPPDWLNVATPASLATYSKLLTFSAPALRM